MQDSDKKPKNYQTLLLMSGNMDLNERFDFLQDSLHWHLQKLHKENPWNTLNQAHRPPNDLLTTTLAFRKAKLRKFLLNSLQRNPTKEQFKRFMKKETITSRKNNGTHMTRLIELQETQTKMGRKITKSTDSAMQLTSIHSALLAIGWRTNNLLPNKTCPCGIPATRGHFDRCKQIQSLLRKEIITYDSMTNEFSEWKDKLKLKETEVATFIDFYLNKSTPEEIEHILLKIESKLL